MLGNGSAVGIPELHGSMIQRRPQSRLIDLWPSRNLKVRPPGTLQPKPQPRKRTNSGSGSDGRSDFEGQRLRQFGFGYVPRFTRFTLTVSVRQEPQPKNMQPRHQPGHSASTSSNLPTAHPGHGYLGRVPCDIGIKHHMDEMNDFDSVQHP